MSLLFLLLLLLPLTGCSTPDTGQVSAKEYVPPRKYTYKCGCIVYTRVGSVSVCAAHNTCTGTRPERYVLSLYHTPDGGEVKHFTVDVSEPLYNQVEHGDWVRRTDDHWHKD